MDITLAWVGAAGQRDKLMLEEKRRLANAGYDLEKNQGSAYPARKDQVEKGPSAHFKLGCQA
jgi:hypothetical protein